METPRITSRRTPSQAPMPSQVRQNFLRNRLFSPDDSGLGISPSPGTPRVRTENMPDVRYFRQTGQYSPGDGLGRVQEEMSNLGDFENQSNRNSGWKKFWVVWMSILMLSIGPVAVAWIYFPDNKVVKRSQENVMTGLIFIIVLVVSTSIFKLILQLSVFTRKAGSANRTLPEMEKNSNFGFDPYQDNATVAPEDSVTSPQQPYDSEVPWYSSPKPTCPVSTGQGIRTLSYPDKHWIKWAVR